MSDSFDECYASFFRLQHREATGLQDKNSVSKIHQLLSSFMGCAASEHCATNDEDRRALAFAKSHWLSGSSSATICVDWFPDYGCALLAVAKTGCARSCMRYLSLVGLDSWVFAIHSSPKQREHDARCHGFAEVAIHPPVEDEKYDDFRKAVASQLRTREADSQKKMSKSTRTPSFVAAVLQDVLNGLEAEPELPRGGFTDVGRHTGSERRDTVWPLLKAVFQAVLNYAPSRPSQTLAPNVIAHFLLWLVESTLDDILMTWTRDLKSANHDLIDGAMEMLDCVVRWSNPLSEAGCDTSVLCQSCVALRERLDAAAALRGREAAGQCQLPNAALEYRRLCLSLPLTNASAQAGGLSEARERSRRNLKWLPMLPAEGTSLSQLLQWSGHQKLQARGDPLVTQALLMGIEGVS